MGQRLTVSLVDTGIARQKSNALVLGGEMMGFCYDDIRRQAKLSGSNEPDALLVAHSSGRMLGVMQISFLRYPMVCAEAPIVSQNDGFDGVARALLDALKSEVLKHSRIEAEVIQDTIPAGYQEAVAGHLEAVGFEDIGQSTYMSKDLCLEYQNPVDIQVKLVSAKERGVDSFIRAVAECSQPPFYDCRTQPRCQSVEGAALTIQDIAGDDSGNIDKRLDQCYIGYRDGDLVAVAVTSPGFLAWIAVRPECRRSGIGRSVLLDLERIWMVQGVRQAGLQVLSTNKGAASLYSALGYKSHGENSPRIWRWRIA